VLEERRRSHTCKIKIFGGLTLPLYATKSVRALALPLRLSRSAESSDSRSPCHIRGALALPFIRLRSVDCFVLISVSLKCEFVEEIGDRVKVIRDWVCKRERTTWSEEESNPLRGMFHD